MTLDIHQPDFTMGIAGAGLMGSGIAQIAAAAGIRVLLYDAAENAAGNARKRLADTFAMLAGKGKITPDAAKAALANIEPVRDTAPLAPCHVLVEAIVERMDAKRALFAELESVVGPECVLATNTSSLSVTELASSCSKPERVAGFHFFSPVPLMKVVEVIAGLRTAPWCLDALRNLAERMGHAPVMAGDSPGFVINNAGRGYPTEGLRLLEECVAEPRVIDRVLREAAGFRMGPFELLDLTGLDVSQPAMEAIYSQFYEEPRFRPSPLGRQRLLGGLLGRKTGEGFYTYRDGKPVHPEPPDAAAPAGSEAAPPAGKGGSNGPAGRVPRVWVSNQYPDLAAKVRRMAAACGADLDLFSVPCPDSLCVVLPLGMDATTESVWEGLPFERTVALDALFGLDTHRTLMGSPATDPQQLETARALFSRDGTPVTVIPDSAGFICQRVVAVIVNIGCDIAQRGLASPEDIDKAVRLGLGYPHGPLAFGDAVGASRILRILEGIFEVTKDPRYRPTPWLRRRAILGLSLATPEPARTAAGIKE